MTTKPVFAITLAMALAGGLSAPAWSQTAPQKSAARALDLDPGPANSAPDPLAPPDVTGPAPAAPGAASAPAATAEEVDPIVALVRERLAAAPLSGRAIERDDAAGLTVFYAEAARPIWTGKDGFTARATAAMGEIRKADDWGLKAAAFDLPAELTSPAPPEALADAEIKLAAAVLKYARYARGGRLDPRSVSRIFDQKPTIYDPKTVLQALAASGAADAYLRELHPQHPQFERLRQAMLEARGVRKEAEAPPPVRIAAGPSIRPGTDHEQVAFLRQRLAVPAVDGNETHYDEALLAAVKAHQRQHGLQPTGVVNGATRAALNEAGQRPSSSDNARRIVLNMERWRWMPEKLGSLYVWDSVPDQMASVVQDGKVVLSEKMVVGKLGSPTPVFSADMQFIIFHPSWGVPKGIKQHELGPQLRKSGGGWFFSGYSASAVLKAHGLRVSHGGRQIDPDSVNWANVDIGSFDFTQPPGPTNVLGIVKFRFPNKHDVYMHDTPERHLFGGATRAFSHGCMRVQNPVRFAEVLLAADKGWATDRVQQYVRTGGEIKLDKPIPVHITYFTAVVDEAGKVAYRHDLYGLDSKLASALEGQAVHVTSAGAPVGEPKPPGERRAAAPSRPRKKPPADTSSNPFAGIFGN